MKILSKLRHFIKKKYIAICLLLIILIAGVLRFYQLGVNPPSLNWDEIAFGYNAYSFSINGKDEFGRFLPHDYIESYGDFKPPVYAYLTVFPIKLFGLNEFSVRFTSALLGTLTVALTFLLTKEIFESRETTRKLDTKLRENWTRNYANIIALLAAFLLAISPWHINLSRGAFEANAATFFIVSGMLFFLLAVKNWKWYLIPSAVMFVLSFYTFNTPRIVVPILVLLLAINFFKWLIANKKVTIVACIAGLLLFLPLLPFLLSSQASLRFREVNIFSDINIIKLTNQEIRNDNNVFWSKIIHHRYLTFGREYIQHYFDHFNPDFLFIRGDDNPRFSTRDVGQMYFWEIPFFIMGIIMLFRKKEGYWWLVPAWLLIGIIPAATARETPHALRIETTLPTFQIFVAYGIVNFVLSIKYKVLRINLRIIALGIIFLAMVFNLIYYINGYYGYYPQEYSGEWQYGYKESVQYAASVQKLYEKIYVDDFMGRPYMYYLFYTKTNPDYFRRTANVERDVFGFVHVKSFGKYEFGNINNFPRRKNVLYISSPSAVSRDAKIIKDFYLLNGTKILTAYTL